MTVEDGFVPTPPAVADYMAKTLFVDAPDADDRILFPGAGTGCLAAGVRRYCSVRGQPCPEAVAVDISADRLDVLEEHVASSTPEVPPLSQPSKRRLRATHPSGSRTEPQPVAMDVETQVTDFLLDPPSGEFDYIVANPPFTRYSGVSSEQREQYRDEFESATGQFSLYVPFVEQMQRLLSDDGTLVFLAPEGYLLSHSTADFRKQLRRDTLEEFMLLPQAVFPNVQVEPVVTTLSADPSLGRDGSFWLEAFIYESRVDELLRDVGVTDEDRRRELTAEYYESRDIIKQILKRRQKRKGEDAGYNVERIPPEYRPGDSHQSDLGGWT